jgi:hypothetical protein
MTTKTMKMRRKKNLLQSQRSEQSVVVQPLERLQPAERLAVPKRMIDAF